MRRREFLGSLAAAGLATAGTTPPAVCEVRDFATGLPVRAAGLNSFCLCDLQCRPYPTIPVITGGRIMFTPPQAPAKFRIGVQLDIPGFGTNIRAFSDNQGRGWTASDFAGPMDLTANIAKDRFSRFTQLYQQAIAKGIVISTATQQRIGRSQHYLNLGLTASEPAQAARCFGQSVTDSIWGGEEVVLQRSQQLITKQGPRPDFNFGCNTFPYDYLGRPFANAWMACGFNFAILNFYMSLVDPIQGHPNWSNIQNTLDWVTPYGAKAKGHPLIWFFPGLGIPTYMHSKGYSQVKRLALDYSSSAMTRFRRQIDYFDVMNEPASTNSLNFTKGQMLDLTESAVSQAAGIDPSAVKSVNFADPWANYMTRQPGLGQTAPYDFLGQLNSAGSNYDVIGLQEYYNGYDLVELEYSIDTFAAFGKPVHITESECPVSGTPNGSAWHGASFTESTQADWLEWTWTLYFSKPNVQMAVWWDLCDPSFLPVAGLMDALLNPRESYARAQSLMAKWKAL